MNLADFLPQLLGGALIGLSATLMLLFNGRVTGVSGIISALFTARHFEFWLRLAFVGGMLLGGFYLLKQLPHAFVNSSDRTTTDLILAGFLVGFGTVMGGGCTSGHGICGVSRLSPRSILATITFMILGFFVVNVLRGGLQ